MQRVSKAEVLSSEQGQHELTLLLGVVFRKARQKLPEVLTLRVTQNFFPRGEADHIKEYLGLENEEKQGESKEEKN